MLWKKYKITNASTAHVFLLYYLKEHNPTFGDRSPGRSWLLDLQTGCRSLVPRGTTVVMCPTDVIDASILLISKAVFYDDIIKWKHFPCCWPFVRGMHLSPANSPHKASDAEVWCSLWFAPWINGWVNTREAGGLRHHRAYYHVIVMLTAFYDTTFVLSIHVRYVCFFFFFTFYCARIEWQLLNWPTNYLIEIWFLVNRLIWITPIGLFPIQIP